MPRTGGAVKHGWVRILREHFQNQPFTTAEAMDLLCEYKTWSMGRSSLAQRLRLSDEVERVGTVYARSDYSGYSPVVVWQFATTR